MYWIFDTTSASIVFGNDIALLIIVQYLNGWHGVGLWGMSNAGSVLLVRCGSYVIEWRFGLFVQGIACEEIGQTAVVINTTNLNSQ